MKTWDHFPIGVIKGVRAISYISKACEVTDEIFTKIISSFNFKTEIELRDFILSEIKNQGLKPSFPPIVTSGIRAGNEIHPTSTGNKLNGFTIIDFGVRYKGFCSDMTRTIFISNGSEVSQSDIDIYNRVLNSQILGISKAQVGLPCRELDRIVRDSFLDDKKYFIHTLGHGIGRFIHEPPAIYYKWGTNKFKGNMVITIEPGIYIKNKLGIRIEDTCLITKKGCIALTKSPKELIVVK
jgi:Xaa-Pro aminopeptidase